MTRIFDFEYPEFKISDIIKDLFFVKTNDRLMAVGVLWFFVCTIYLLLLNLCAIGLILTFQIIYLCKFYTIGMSIIFMCRLLLGYILEYLV